MSQILTSFNNSTTVPLGADANFIGQADILTSYAELDICVARVPATATATLYFEFSPDGYHWDVSVPLLITNANHPPISLRTILPYFRLRYYNGATPLTELRLTTIFHRATAGRLTRFLNQPIDPLEPIQLVRVAATEPAVGAATDTTLSTRLSEATFLARTNTLGQKTMAGSEPVVIASDQSPLSVSVSNFPATQPISGSVSVSNLPADQLIHGPISGTVAVSSLPAISGSVSVSNFPATQPISGSVSVSNLTADQLVHGSVSVSNFPATQPVSGTVAVSNFPATQVISGTVTANLGTTDSLALDATLTNGTQISKAKRSTTGTHTDVASSASSVTILAANANRLGAIIFNDSSKILIIKLGATASATSFTTQLVANTGYYEVPTYYTGIIDGIWAGANGFARVTELT